MALITARQLNNETLVSTGGNYYAIVPAATAGTIVKAFPGRLCKVIVQAAMATTPLTFYDNPLGTATGNTVLVIPITATQGQIFTVDIVCNLGISAVGGTGQTACTVTFI